ncbi:MAG: hypothetical protein ACI9MR_002559 [Myxococcota bacterium]|jgi:hypothetical protein
MRVHPVIAALLAAFILVACESAPEDDTQQDDIVVVCEGGYSLSDGACVDIDDVRRRPPLR